MFFISLPTPTPPPSLLYTPWGLGEQTGLKPTEGSEGKAWQLTSHPEQGGVRGSLRWGEGLTTSCHAQEEASRGTHRWDSSQARAGERRTGGSSSRTTPCTLRQASRKRVSHFAPTPHRAHPAPGQASSWAGTLPPTPSWRGS